MLELDSEDLEEHKGHWDLVLELDDEEPYDVKDPEGMACRWSYTESRWEAEDARTIETVKSTKMIIFILKFITIKYHLNYIFNL